MIDNKKILCVITARAGSKGIPHKNVMGLLGKPLFIWSIESALESKYIDKIVISTDCDKVINEISKYKIKKDNKRLCVVVRPKKISGDMRYICIKCGAFLDKGFVESDVKNE